MVKLNRHEFHKSHNQLASEKRLGLIWQATASRLRKPTTHIPSWEEAAWCLAL